MVCSKDMTCQVKFSGILLGILAGNILCHHVLVDNYRAKSAAGVYLIDFGSDFKLNHF